jgi:hypothetical protein
MNLLYNQNKGKFMKKLLSCLVIIIALSQTTYAVTTGAIFDGKNLFVGLFGDNCNSYSRIITIENKCLNDGSTRECEMQSKVILDALPKTRMICNSKKVRMFDIDLTKEVMNLNDFILVVNGQEVKVASISTPDHSDSDDSEVKETSYKCVVKTKVNTMCRRVGGCTSTYVELLDEQGILVEKFKKASKKELLKQCNELKNELES